MIGPDSSVISTVRQLPANIDLPENPGDMILEFLPGFI